MSDRRCRSVHEDTRLQCVLSWPHGVDHCAEGPEGFWVWWQLFKATPSPPAVPAGVEALIEHVATQLAVPMLRPQEHHRKQAEIAVAALRPAVEREVIEAVCALLRQRSERAFGVATGGDAEHERRWTLVAVTLTSLAMEIAGPDEPWRAYLPGGKEGT